MPTKTVRSVGEIELELRKTNPLGASESGRDIMPYRDAEVVREVLNWVLGDTVTPPSKRPRNGR